MDIPYTVRPRPDTGLYNAKVGIWLFLASEVMLFGALFSAYVLLRVGADPGEWLKGVLSVPIGTVNTVVLITSSITVVMAWASLKMNDFKKFRFYQGATVLLALTFAIIKSFEYREKFQHYTIWKQDGAKVVGHIEGNPYFWTHKTLDKKGMDHVMFIPDAPKGEKHAAHPEPIKIERKEIRRLSAYVPAHSTYFAIYFTMTGLHALHVLGGAVVMFYFWGPGNKMWLTEPARLTNRIEVSGLFWHFVDLVWIFLFPLLYLL